MKLKNYTKILITTLIFTLLFGKTTAYAWDDCPKGKVNDPYPGDCARYADTDGNGICDHSEPAPEDREEIAAKEGTNSAEDQTSTSDNKNIAYNTMQEKASGQENRASTFWSKTSIALVIVGFHLVGILVYTKHKKAHES